jgi:hypothetical protein
MAKEQLPAPTDSVISQQVGDTLFIYASKIDLRQGITGYPGPADGRFPLSKCHIRIQADTATIVEPLVNRGMDFTIVARRIVFNAGALIDVSGPDPETDFRPNDRPQQVNMEPGANGANGAGGSNGISAGNITLVAESIERGTASPTEALRLIADGGRGGRGQNGQIGRPGKAGDNAPYFNERKYSQKVQGPLPSPSKTAREQWLKDHVYSNPKLYGNWFGRQGGAGGRGGAGGPCGKGGPGGKIFVRAAKRVPMSSVDVASGGGSGLLPPGPPLVSVSFAGGPASAPSSGGAGGTGGPGGFGTKVKCDYWEGRTAIASYSGMTPNGSQGPSGAAGPDSYGSEGVAGTVDITGGQSYEDLARFVDLPLLLMTQRLAKFTYLNAGSKVRDRSETRDYRTPCELFQWLARITEPAPRIGLPGDVRNVWTAVNTAANVELARFSKGLDYYGHTFTWVPILTLSYLSRELDAVLPLAQRIEDDYFKFSNQKSQAIDRANAYNKARESLKEVIQQLSDAAKALNETIDSTFKSTQTQAQAIALQQQRVELLQEKFKSAWQNYVAKHKPVCSFSDVLDVMKAIVAVGQTAYEGIGDVRAAYNAVGAVVSDISKFKGAIENIQKVAADVGKIGKAWQDFRGTVTSDSPDAVKLVITEQDFDKTIEPYMKEIPAEAGALKDAVHHFFDLIKSRNTLLLNYNALYVNKLDLETRRKQQQAQLDGLAENFDRDNLKDLNLPVYTVFMTQAYDAARDYAVWLLYQECRAYEYWSLTEPEPFELSDLLISFLNNSHLGLKRKITEAMAATQSVKGLFEDQPVQFDLTDGASALAQLWKTKRMTLRIDPDALSFQNFWDVRATEVAVFLPDVDRASDRLTIRLLHNGDSILVDRKGKRRAYTHERREMGFVFDYKNQKITGHAAIGDENEGFVNLSPFTTWDLDFGLPGNEWLDVTLIKSVILSFRGFWRINPAYAKRMAAQRLQSSAKSGAGNLRSTGKKQRSKGRITAPSVTSLIAEKTRPRPKARAESSSKAKP